MHLSVAYILIAGQDQELAVKPVENSGVAWFSIESFDQEHFSPRDLYLYKKLIQRPANYRPSWRIMEVTQCRILLK